MYKCTKAAEENYKPKDKVTVTLKSVNSANNLSETDK